MTITIDLDDFEQATEYGLRLADFVMAATEDESGQELATMVNALSSDEAHTLLYCAALLLTDYV